jgi:TPR repeat protein
MLTLTLPLWTPSKIRTASRRLGASSLLLACSLCSALPASAYSGTTKDLTHLRSLAEQGSVHDEIVLAGHYFIGSGVTQDSKMAAYWYEKAAGHGSPEAQNQIGYFYQAGIGVPPDTRRALHWYQLSSSSGFAPAKVNLAVAYLRGIGVERNEDLAVRLLTQAFQRGNGTAATYLGHLYYFGIGVKQDKAAAERWFEAGLKLHDPLAAFDLGTFYSVNQDHSRDLPRAVELLRQSADAGYVQAMHSLGLLLINHPELKQDPPQVRSLLLDAADAGSWKSSIVLGILARDGRGTPMDKKSAYLHFRIAVLQGGAEAAHVIKRDMDALGAEIGREESQIADAAAGAWFEHHTVSLSFVVREGAAKGDFPMAAVASASDESPAGQLLPLSGS